MLPLKKKSEKPEDPVISGEKSVIDLGAGSDMELKYVAFVIYQEGNQYLGEVCLN